MFNDPFDHQVKFLLPFSPNEFITEFELAIERVIFGKDNVLLDLSTQTGQLFSLMRSGRDNLRKDEVMAELRSGLEAAAETLQSFEDNVNQLLHQQLRMTRVLCVSEHNDNIIMWSHYADEHKGVVMRLQCIDELDNNLLIARKMQYQKAFSVIATLDDFVKFNTGEKSTNWDKVLTDIAYVKHEDWRYEHEWRVSTSEPTPNENLYNDYSENPRVFGAVYFGCRISDKDKDEIVDMLNGHYGHVEILQARKRTQEFGLHFERIR